MEGVESSGSTDVEWVHVSNNDSEEQWYEQHGQKPEPSRTWQNYVSKAEVNITTAHSVGPYIALACSAVVIMLHVSEGRLGLLPGSHVYTGPGHVSCIHVS